VLEKEGLICHFVSCLRRNTNIWAFNLFII
jgi:hypothetical protein